MQGELAGDVQFPAQFTQVGNTQGINQRVPEFYLLDGQIREGFI
jgi:hypothetical protein